MRARAAEQPLLPPEGCDLICGIWGISYGPLGPDGEEWTASEFAEILFPAVVHRGPHAYGWMSFNPADGITIEKHIGRADTKKALATMRLDHQAKWVVGHVRYATHGDPKNLNNNHPLVHGSIVGVHNGVLRNYASILRETGREKDNTQVDSEAIFAAVHKWGMRGGLARIQGDMVTVFANTAHPDVLRIARSHGRPLVYATTPNGSLIFASECAVIEATGIDLIGGQTPYYDLTGRNRMLTVRQGRITERTQYRSDSWKSFEGGVSGITDLYDSGIPKPPPQRHTAQQAIAQANKGRNAYRSIPPAPVRTSKIPDAPRGLLGTTGDRYLGSGVYRTADGRTMDVDQYVDHRVEQALATIRNNNQGE